MTTLFKQTSYAGSKDCSCLEDPGWTVFMFCEKPVRSWFHVKVTFEYRAISPNVPRGHFREKFVLHMSLRDKWRTKGQMWDKRKSPNALEHFMWTLAFSSEECWRWRILCELICPFVPDLYLICPSFVPGTNQVQIQGQKDKWGTRFWRDRYSNVASH